MYNACSETQVRNSSYIFSAYQIASLVMLRFCKEMEFVLLEDCKYEVLDYIDTLIGKIPMKTQTLFSTSNLEKKTTNFSLF